MADARPAERPRRSTPWLRLALLAALVVGLGWAWHHWALWPLKMVVVLFHELGHALAALATGGAVVEIHLSPNEGGHALTRGGSRLVILNAGYLGSLVAGMGLLAGSRHWAVARGTALCLALLLVTADLLFVPWFTFAWAFTGLTAIAFGVAALLVPAIAVKWGLRTLGVFSVLYAFLDIWSDVFARAFDADVVSDAELLEQATGIPALAWGAAWVVAGAVLLVLTRRWLM